jgi:hypothetical protein
MNQNNINNNLLKAVDCIENIKDKITDKEYKDLLDTLMAANNQIGKNTDFVSQTEDPDTELYIINPVNRRYILKNMCEIHEIFLTGIYYQPTINEFNRNIESIINQLDNFYSISYVDEYKLAAKELKTIWSNILFHLNSIDYNGNRGINCYKKNYNKILNIINLKPDERYNKQINNKFCIIQ